MSSAEMSVPNHRRTKPGERKAGPVNSGATGPSSQIPGLSQNADEVTPVEKSSGRRVGIFESDSDYVKLAKGGGHKGLLSHDVDVVDKPVKPYNPPNWFKDNGANGGSKATSPDENQMKGRQVLSAPFGTDNGSTWEREADRYCHDKEKTSPDGVACQMDRLSMTNKYKRTSHDKNAPPVSMTKLLSHGYMEDKMKSPNDDDCSSVTSEQTSIIETEDAEELE